MAHPGTKEDLTAKAEILSNQVRYEDDLYGWVGEQVALLRDGAIASIDVTNIAEELSDVGAEQYNKLEGALEILLLHMLKWDHQPDRRSRSWTLSIEEHRLRVEKQLRKNPSLKSRLDEAIEDGFRLGRLRAAREMRVPSASLPTSCPYDWATIVTRPFALDGD